MTRLSFWNAIRRHFLDKLVLGALVWVPLYVTFKCLFILISFLDRIFSPWIETWVGFHVFGASFVLILLFFYLTGMIILGKAGRWMLGGILSFLGSIPILSWVFQPLHLWVKTLVFEHGQIINELALIQYPRERYWTLGIILRQMNLFNKNYFCVFIPTLINPLTGYTAFSSEEFICKTQMSYNDGLKMLMSVGVVAPERVL